MGINIPTKEELIANHLKADQLAQQLGELFSIGQLFVLMLTIAF